MTTRISPALSTVLENHGYEVAVESVAERAVERIRHRRPDAVILNVMFPESDTSGFEVARAIRRAFGELPVLMLTAVNQSFPLGFSKEDQEATWLPVAEFLEKPVDFALLREKLASMLAKK